MPGPPCQTSGAQAGRNGYLRVVDGRIRRVDLVCTGFVPEHDLPGGRST